MIFSRNIETPIGSMQAYSVDEGICLLSFSDCFNLESEIKKISTEFGTTIKKESSKTIDLLDLQLTEYFERRRKSFTVPLCLVGTNFQKKIWNQLLSIEFGRTITYKEQALAYGDAYAIRAVARANGENRIPIIIPCHRVVGSNGDLTGYSGGLWRKKYLLDLEDCQYEINF